MSEVVKRGVGKPPFQTDPDEVSAKIDEYFELRTIDETPPTYAGLALHLGLKNRQSLHVYSKKPEFKDVISYAKLRMEEIYERRLHGNNPTGAIFALKNYGWSDRQEIEHTGTIQIDVRAVREKVEKRIEGMASRLLGTGR